MDNTKELKRWLRGIGRHAAPFEPETPCNETIAPVEPPHGAVIEQILRHRGL